MYINNILFPYVRPELPDSLKKWKAFNVTYGAPDFNNNYVHIAGNQSDAAFDLVGYVRDDLHCPSKINSFSFFIYNRVVDFACGKIIVFP